MNDQPYPWGIDCLWLASDRDGRLGAFLTGGAGPIPMDVLAASSFPVTKTGAMLCRQPKIAAARLLVSLKRPDDFIDLAERGFHVYDWSDMGRTSRGVTGAYEPIAMPETPISIDDLPDELAAVARLLRMDAVCFGDGIPLDMETLLVCTDGE